MRELPLAERNRRINRNRLKYFIAMLANLGLSFGMFVASFLVGSAAILAESVDAILDALNFFFTAKGEGKSNKVKARVNFLKALLIFVLVAASFIMGIVNLLTLNPVNPIGVMIFAGIALAVNIFSALIVSSVQPTEANSTNHHHHHGHHHDHHDHNHKHKHNHHHNKNEERKDPHKESALAHALSDVKINIITIMVAGLMLFLTHNFNVNPLVLISMDFTLTIIAAGIALNCAFTIFYNAKILEKTPDKLPDKASQESEIQTRKGEGKLDTEKFNTNARSIQSAQSKNIQNTIQHTYPYERVKNR
jgi:Co/Zn/Cd efflux system component